MMKKVLNSALVFTFVFSLNAKNSEQIITKEFGDSNFKITIEYKPEAIKNVNGNNEKLIIETVTRLTKEIVPAQAAKEYLGYMKSVFEKIKSDSVFDDLKECESIEESSQKFGLIMKSLMSDMSKNENVLKQSVYFAALSNEAISELMASISTEMQKYMLEVNRTIMESVENIKEKTEEEVKAINLNLQNIMQVKSRMFFDTIIDAATNVLKEHYDF